VSPDTGSQGPGPISSEHIKTHPILLDLGTVPDSSPAERRLSFRLVQISSFTALPHPSLAMPKLDELLRENGRREPSRSLGPEGRPAKRQPSPEGLGING
jgi:hypothetical protein